MKKIFLTLIAMAIFITPAFAQSFSDLPATHWAYGVVEEMVKEGIISGYSDGTFKPSKEISNIESIILLAKISGVQKYTTEADSYLKKYESDLAKYTTQYKKEAAYLMELGVIGKSDLDNLLKEPNSPLTREEMAVLVTKVLGKDADAKKNTIVVLPFSDTSSISSSARPYVYYVYSEKIMNGMDGNIFSPKTSLTRAQVASILQRIYKKVNLKPTTNSSPSTTTPSATSFITGTITQIDTSASSVFIKSNGKTEEYEYDSKTKFYVNGKETTSAAMKKNATVTVTLTDDAYITNMSISEGAKVVTKTVKGTIYSTNTTNTSIVITSSGSRLSYKYDKSTEYTLDGKASTLAASIKKDYEVTLTIDTNTNYIVKAATISPDDRIIGKITAVSTKDGYVVFEDEDDKEYILMDNYIDEYDESYDDEKEDYYFDDDTKFKYNGASKTYKNIATTSFLYKKGNYIAITLGKKDYIDLIEVATKESTLTDGTVVEDDKTTNKNEIYGDIVKASANTGYVVIEDLDTGEEYVLVDAYIDDYDGDYDDKDEDYYFDDDTDFYFEGEEEKYSDMAKTSYLFNDDNFIRIVFNDKDYITEIEIAEDEDDLEGSSSSSKSDDETVLIGEIIEADDDIGYIVIEVGNKEYVLMDDYIGNYDDDYEGESEDYYFDDDTKFYYEGDSENYSDLDDTSGIYDEGMYVKITIDDDDYITKFEIAEDEDDLDEDSETSDDEALTSEDMLKDNYLVGEITDIDDDEITIECDDGEEYTIDVLSYAMVLDYSDDDPDDDMIEYDEAYDDEDIEEDDRVMVILCDDEETALIILID